MASKDFITQEYLKECFLYNEKTGGLIWKNRPLSHFDNEYDMRRFHTRRSGRPAGSIQAYKNHTNIQVNIKKKIYKAHRLIWLYVYGYTPKEIDHINGDATDNRLENLREVCHVENMRNAKLSVLNKTGVTGVSYSERHKKYRARIMVRGKDIALGFHNDFFDAICARKSAEVKHRFHKNHGRCVFID